MRALVTGAAGFLGAALVERLLAEDHVVDAVDDLSSGSLANLAAARAEGTRRLSFHQIDVRDPTIVELATRRRPDVVFHLAARAHDGLDGGSAVTASVGILGSLQVVEAARVAGADKVVFASSAAVYGEPAPADLPLRESQAQVPTSLRGVVERAVTDHLAIYRARHELEFTALVLGCVYGPGQRAEGPDAVVARLVDDLRAGRPSTVPGLDHTRDLVFVDDAVDAFVRAAERGGGLSCHVATGVETRLGDLHAMVARSLGLDDPPPPRIEPDPDAPRRCALDPGRAAIHLGWRPWTDLEAGLAEVLART
ncbi:MAG: NAD-dependent epimerase/dehydratase family protein [Acidimicrobiia bacterium]